MPTTQAQIDCLNDIRREFDCHLDSGRGPKQVLDELRDWRSKKAEHAMRERDNMNHLLSLIGESRGDDQAQAVKETCRQRVMDILDTPIPRPTQDSMREFALRHARKAMRLKTELEEKSFRMENGGSLRGLSDHLSQRLNHHRTRAIEYIQTAQHLSK